jgi:uncharacterized membrane protein
VCERTRSTRLLQPGIGGAHLARERNTDERLSAYSDAVFAVIVTIMVLQLKAPESAKFSALFVLWPTITSYVVSYVFIAIIWINHHYLTRLIANPSLKLVWANFIHLFFVSLLPFTTAWMAQTKLAPIPVVVYAGLFVVTDGAYNIFESGVLRQSNEISERGRRHARRRSLLALTLFASAAVTAAFVPWGGFGLICVALVLHLKPDVDLDSLRRRRSKGRNPVISEGQSGPPSATRHTDGAGSV